jgi:hypothetical protein
MAKVIFLIYLCVPLDLLGKVEVQGGTKISQPLPLPLCTLPLTSGGLPLPLGILNDDTPRIPLVRPHAAGKSDRNIGNDQTLVRQTLCGYGHRIRCLGDDGGGGKRNRDEWSRQVKSWGSLRTLDHETRLWAGYICSI